MLNKLVLSIATAMLLAACSGAADSGSRSAFHQAFQRPTEGRLNERALAPQRTVARSLALRER